MEIDSQDFEERMQLAMEGLGHDLRREFRKAAPKDTGHLYRNIEVKVKDGKIEFSFPEYALYLEYGTGLFNEYPGAQKKKIEAKDKQALAFEYKGKTIVVKSIKGMTPRPFIRPTMHQKFMDLMIKNLNANFKDIKIRL
jgi:hypothetical protein